MARYLTKHSSKEELTEGHSAEGYPEEHLIETVRHFNEGKELLIDPQAQSKLLAWRNYVIQEGYIPLD